MPRKKQGLRSYHHKSRNGCSNCKRRRVKCNMQAPACANCVRRNEACKYQTLSGSASPVPPQWSSEIPGEGTTTSVGFPISSFHAVSSSFPSYAPPPYMVPHAGPNTGTIESNTSPPISISSILSSLFNRSWFTPVEATLWAAALDKQAAKYPYLAHCIYSLAYLRQDLLDYPIQGSPMSAYQHQVTASTLFRQAPPIIDEDNWLAVIAFHVFLLVFQFSTQATCDDADFNLPDTLRILRSSMNIESEAMEYFHKSRFWQLILQRTNLPPQEFDMGLKANLQSLANLISASIENEYNDDDDEERAEINRQAFWELREWAVQCDAKPRRWNQYCVWPGKTTPEFLDLLIDGDDIALLLLIHWCTIMYESPKPCVYNWAKRTAYYAIDSLEGDWGDLLAWPLEKLAIPKPQHLPAYMLPLGSSPPPYLPHAMGSMDTQSLLHTMANVNLPILPSSTVSMGMQLSPLSTTSTQTGDYPHTSSMDLDFLPIHTTLA